jgi:predicted AlkP superfamily phosphohydrolase/phosphomutase
MLARGELPNLARLRDRGGSARVATTCPAQTPVAWSSFATGTNPGGHGIFDFVRRDPKTYLPDIALNRYEQKNAFLPPKVVNLRRGEPLWGLLATAGVGATVLRCPCTYPPDPVRGRSLSGMGVPDLRGGLGTPTFYTTAADAAPRESENLVKIAVGPDGTVATHLIGPRNPKTRDDIKFDFSVRLDPAGDRALIRSDGSPRELEVRTGAWSDWLHVKFKLGMLLGIKAVVRFHLVRTAPELELYASPVNFDPKAPLFPISAPPEYAGELAGRIGTYSTTGMVEDHTGLNNERISEEAFLDQCEAIWREREAMMLDALGKFDSGLFYCLYDTPDRVQHMMWRTREPDHPANRGRDPRPDLAGVIEDHYRRGDQALGRALEFADDNTLVIALSDHGFNSFRRGVHLNSWLLEQGFLALREGLAPGDSAGDMLRGVDWDRTRAYALGLSGIYLNLRGREERGIVDPAEADALKAAIASGLSGLHDPQDGTRPIRSVRPREEVYSGPFAGESPDLMVNFAAGYRISWGSATGGVPDGLVEDNVKKWAGDHIIDPALVPGVLFMNRPFRGEGARLIDLAPTILAALGVPKGPAMEGDSLLS